MRLLIVDDDPDFRSIIERTAPSWLDVVSCSSSREAVGLLTSKEQPRPMIALIDLSMDAYLARSSDLEGLALITWMQMQGRSPFVIVASSLEPSSLLFYEKEKVLGTLRKPVELERLYRFLNAYDGLFRVSGEN